MRRAASALALAAALLGAGRAGAQTLGTITVSAGGGVSVQHSSDFTPLGPQLWAGGETVLERRLRVRVAMSVQRFAYHGPGSAACAPTRFCAPPITSALFLAAVTGTAVWRDTTGANPWYALGGLGAFSDLNGRDSNSRIGLVAGIGRSFGATRDWFVEAKVDVPYDAYGYGTVVPITVGRRFFRFTP